MSTTTNPDTSRLSLWNIAEDHPDRTALIEPNGFTLTFKELRDAVERLAHGLSKLGVTPGQVVAAALPNCKEFIICEHAALRSGFYFVPVNCHLTAEETAHVLLDSEAVVLVGHERFAEEAIQAADQADLDAKHRFAVGEISGFSPIEQLMTAQRDGKPKRMTGTRMAYTSGTTGMPKGIRRALPPGDPAENLARSSFIGATGFGNQPGPGVCLTCGPLHHAGPSMLSLATLHVGYTQVLMDKWKPEDCLRLIDQYQVTCSQMVPTMFHRLLQLPEEVKSKYDTSSLNSIMHTGAPCPKEIKQRIMDWFGPVVYETYGGTEGAATIATPKRWLQKPGTVGRPINGVKIRILDDEGNDQPFGEIGEIYILARKGAKTEYFKDPEKTRSIWNGDYFTLGDMGYLDEDGFLFISDRKKDMIISGGVNIFPAESESVLMTHPSVQDVAIIGIPDPDWGESAKAVVQLTDGSEATPELEKTLIEYCREKIAHYKCPRSIDFRQSLPRAENGKLYKRRIRDEYWKGHDQRV